MQDDSEIMDLKRVNVVIDDEAHQVLLNFQKKYKYPSKDKALAEFLRKHKDDYSVEPKK